MKASLAALATLLTLAATAAGGYFFAQRQYAAKPDLAETRAVLAALETEVAGLKQALARQQSETADQRAALQHRLQALGIDRSEWNQINATLVSVQEAVQGLRAAAVSKTELTAALDAALRSVARYHPVDLGLGPLPSGNPKELSYRIGDGVPDSAREILVYAYVATNYVKGGAQNFKIFVNTGPAGEAAFYLYAVANTQQEWSFNSDNMWLPMPEDRELRLQANGEALFGKWESGVRIVAYR